MTKFKLGMAAAAAAVLAFGVAACGQTTTRGRDPAAVEDTGDDTKLRRKRRLTRPRRTDDYDCRRHDHAPATTTP